jgi:hypothetical protein
LANSMNVQKSSPPVAAESPMPVLTLADEGI